MEEAVNRRVEEIIEIKVTGGSSNACTRTRSTYFMLLGFEFISIYCYYRPCFMWQAALHWLVSKFTSNKRKTVNFRHSLRLNVCSQTRRNLFLYAEQFLHIDTYSLSYSLSSLSRKSILSLRCSWISHEIYSPPSIPGSAPRYSPGWTCQNTSPGTLPGGILTI